MKVVLPVTIATGAGDRLHLQTDRSVVLRLESNRSKPPQAHAFKLLQAKELATIQRNGNFRPPLRWGLNE